VLVVIDEGNNEGVGDDVLDMEKIVTVIIIPIYSSFNRGGYKTSEIYTHY
jgi:hypothetical protein